MLKHQNLLLFTLFIASAYMLITTGLLSAAEPLHLIDKNLKESMSTFQTIALSITGIALVGVAVAGAFTQLNKAVLLNIFFIIILIAGATLFVDWIAGFIKK